MSKFNLWAAVSTAVLCLPSIATSADSATEANQKGQAAQKKGESDAAIAAFTEKIRHDPKDADAFFGRGVAYEKKGEADKAIADYTEAIRLDPKLGNAYSNRGVVYEGKGDMEKALADYTEAIRLDPKSAIGYYNRGIAYAKKGDLDKAIADYTEAIRINPKLVLAYANRARAYEKKGEDAKANEDIAAAEKLGYKEVPARKEPGGLLGRPAVTVLLILAAVICLGLYWVVRQTAAVECNHQAAEAVRTDRSLLPESGPNRIRRENSGWSSADYCRGSRPCRRPSSSTTRRSGRRS